MNHLEKYSLIIRRWANYLLAAFGLLFGLGSFLSFAFGMNYLEEFGIAYILWLLLLTLSTAILVAFRHRHPMTITVLALLSIGLSFIPLPFVATWWALPIISYHAGKHLQRFQRNAVLAVATLFALLMGYGFALLMLGESSYTSIDFAQLWTFNTALCVVVIVLAWTWGTTSRLRLLRQQELEERAQRLEQEREQERSLAAVDERSRIAREMHDIVAHSLSVIVTQSDGARYATLASQDVNIATQALEQIGQVSREALAQTRGVLGLLRSSSETELAPLPDLESLGDLVEIARASGLDVNFSGVEGAPARPVSAGVQLAAYRVVQEALTNIRKHATGARSSVTCIYDKEGVTIEVVNEAPPTLVVPLPGAGKGLQGMSERVALYHGELIAAPLFTGGFQVKAFFPYSDT